MTSTRWPWFWFGLAILGGISAMSDEAPVLGQEASRRAVSGDRIDVHSWSNPHEVRVCHVELDLAVEFNRKQLAGSATLTLDRGTTADGAATLWLDTRDLAVSAVSAGTAAGLAAVPYRIENPAFPADEVDLFPRGDRSDGHPIHGRALRVELPPMADRVKVEYATSPNATALQWLEPAQTAGGASPFLFTQSQAIHARSWIPIQDTPGVRVTYSATIHVPNGLKAVMSAAGNFQEGGDGADGTFRFTMDKPIPAYLIALGVGDLAFRPIGKRTGVYAEPSLVDQAAAEFADTETMVEMTEKRFGPYRWGRYDLLVLPPSFPFGGMENPCLTFATPTILAGDKSLVSLVAHELAHSWSGNLVTNATWSDFWLNEGFTTYIENRIIEDVYGADRAAMESVLGLQELRAELARLPEGDQILHIDLAGRDPDDGVTRVPYEKGKSLIYALERAFGRDRFDAFIRAYFDHYAFQSIPTVDFERYLGEHLLAADAQAAAKVDLRQWIDQPGLPVFDEPKSDRFTAVDEAARRWLAGELAADAIDAMNWTTQEWLRFLRALPAPLDAGRMAELDARFKLTERRNAEIAAQWLEMAIRSKYASTDPRLEEFLTTIGRRKFLMPLYRALMESPEGKERAKAIYAKARPRYHPIAVESIDQLLGSEGG